MSSSLSNLTLPPVPKQPFVKMEDGAISVVLAAVMFTVMVLHHVYSILTRLVNTTNGDGVWFPIFREIEDN